MKKRIIILTVLLGSLSSLLAQGLLEQKISIEAHDMPIYSVLNTIEKEYIVVRFSYSPDLLDLQKVVSISVEDQTLESVLQKILHQTAIEYVEMNKNIALRLKQEDSSKKLEAKQGGVINSETGDESATANSIEENNTGEFYVTGVVVDETGETLPATTVQVKNTFVGVSTNIDGRYSINVKSGSNNAVLLFSYLGMETQEVAVDGRHTVNVILKEGENKLEEVVIVGYGSKRKSDVVGSMTTIKSEAIAYAMPTTLDKMLEGAAPGLMVTSVSSEPGAKTEVRIRGESSIDGVNTPLYIVDGVPFTTEIEMEVFDGFSFNPLASINPDDIESVTVLKDAAATSIYGANASNGVILITTKRGRSGETSVTVSANVGVQTRLDNSFERLNTAEYVELMTEASVNAGYSLEQATAMAGRTDVDVNWPSLVYQTGINQSYNVSARGGNDNVRFYSSIAFSKQEGVVKGNSLQRASIRLNLDHDIGRKAKISYSLSPTLTKKEYFSILGDVNEILPNIPVYNDDGSYNNDIEFHPLAILDQNDYDGKGNRIIGNVKFDYDVLDWLNLGTTVGFDSYDNTDMQYLSMLNQTGADHKGLASRTNTKNFKWYWNSMAKFKHEKGKNRYSGLASLELSDNEVNTLSARASNFPNDFMRELSSGSEYEYAGSRKSESSQVSYFAKVDYAYDSKYFLMASFRNDASSIFGGDTKSSKKGSVGASWMMSKEDWFRSRLGAVDMLKLRGSLGTAGNSRIGTYASRGTYTYNGADYNNQPGSAPLYPSNPNLSWETSMIYNIGVDFRVNRFFSGTVEYYLKNNFDLLSKSSVSEVSGFSNATQNLGDSRNTGWEFTLKSTPVKTEDFDWNVTYLCSFEKSIFTKLYYGNNRVVGTRIIREGESVRAIYLQRWAGVDPATGKPLWYDKEGNTVDYRSNDDKVIVGSSSPDFYGSLVNTLRYKGFELRLFATYTYGNLVYNSSRAEAESDGDNIGTENQNKNQMNRWQNPGDITDVPKIVLNNETGSNYYSTRFLEDGSNINLKNVSLSYNAKKAITDPLGLGSLRFTFAVDNVFVFSGFKSLSTANGKLSSFYPDMRTYQFSMTLRF